MDTGRQLLPDPDSHDGFFYAVLEKPDAENLILGAGQVGALAENWPMKPTTSP